MLKNNVEQNTEQTVEPKQVLVSAKPKLNLRGNAFQVENEQAVAKSKKLRMSTFEYEQQTEKT